MRGLSLGVLFALGCSQPPVHTDLANSRSAQDWVLLDSLSVPGASSVSIAPDGNTLWISTPNGVWRGGLDGGVLPLVEQSGIGAVEADPAGTLFLSLPGDGGLLTVTDDGNTTPFFNSLSDVDDDPVGLAFAPSDYSGPVLQPGEGIVVDRGVGGPDGAWRFDPTDSSVSPVRVVSDDSAVRDIVDIAISSDGIFLIDPRESSGGRLFELTEDDVERRTILGTLVDPTGLVWDPVGACLVFPDAGTGLLQELGPDDEVASTIAALPGGAYPTSTRANIALSPDAALLAVASNDAVHLYGRCDDPEEQADCDGNGVDDTCDRVLGPSVDCDGNGILDACETFDDADCDGDGVHDACPQCLALDVALVLPSDTQTLGHVCDVLPSVDAELAARGIDATLTVYTTGAADDRCGNVPIVDQALPAAAPDGITPLNQCIAAQSAWLPGTAIAADLAFASAPTRRRVVIPTLTGPSTCVPSSGLDDAVVWVGNTAAGLQASIHPVVLGGADTAVPESLASSTGGRVHTASEFRLADALIDAITTRCATADDCDQDGDLDACQPAAPGTPDCDCDGTFDGCGPLGQPLCTDIDEDGIGRTCDDCVDTDEDGVANPGEASSGCTTPGVEDSCPATPNPDQIDSDGDGFGDACDPCDDPDDDGVGAGCLDQGPDNCPDDANPTQQDADGDGLGDVCDPCDDSDGDGAGDIAQADCPIPTADNCVATANPSQQDADGDGLGDACDGCEDRDRDGFGTGSDCAQPGDDCDDNDAGAYPGAPETPYDGVDQDCDGLDACDLDGDGVDAIVCGGTDCDDSDAAIRPGATEIDGDGIDQDCDPTNELGGCSCSSSPAPWSWLVVLLAIGWARTARPTRPG